MFIKPRHALQPISLSGIYKDGLGINMTMKTSFTLHITSCEKHSMEWRLPRVVPTAAVTTDAKSHAQQQLARDLEVERAPMGQRCRPQSFGEVQRGNPQPRRWLYFL